MNYYSYLEGKLDELDNYFEQLLIRQAKPKNNAIDSSMITNELKYKSIEELPNIHVKDGSIYEYGGIYDDIDKAVFGDHYSTSHYITYCSMNLNKDHDRYINNINTSIPFLAKTNIDYIYGHWTPHRDFNNLANIITYMNVKNRINSDANRLLRNSIIHTKVNLRNRATNWVLMRSLFYRLRYLEFGNYLDYIKYRITLKEATKRQLADGCIEDKKGKSDPIQYHVYSLVLFMRIYELERNNDVKEIIELGLEYFVSFFNFQGNFNYKGRGQQQIFGYSIGLYALLFALNNNLTINKTKYRDALIKLLDYMKKYLDKEQIPLTFNEFPSKYKVGWYDYHHYTVYVSFFMLWTSLSMKEFKNTLREINVNYLKNSTKTEVFKIFNKSEVYIYNNSNYFMSISGRKGEYLSDFGFSFDNLNIIDYGDLITCPGGPSLNKYGKLNVMKNVELNYFTPIIIRKDNSNHNPIIESESIVLNNSSKNNVKLTLKSKIVHIIREIKLLENQLIIIDEVIKQGKNSENDFTIYLNIPIIGNDWHVIGNTIFNKKISIKFISSNHKINCYKKGKMLNAAGQVTIAATASQKLCNYHTFNTIITILN